MFSTLSRIIKYGLLDFKRNAWLSTSTIAILVLALIVFSGLYLFNIFTNTVISSIQNKIDISVYFKGTTPEDDILRIKSVVEEMPEVKLVEYISKDKALEIFKEKHKDDETISKALEQIAKNPLLASLNIKAENPEEYSVIAAYLNNNSIKPFIDNVSYSQNATVIKRLSEILHTAKSSGIAITLFMSLLAILITFNTIRLAIYSGRESISIMRLVGSTNYFVRGPFLVEAIMYGIFSTIITGIIIVPIIYFITPYSAVLVPELNLWNFFIDHIIRLFFYLLSFGIGLGIISSFFATSRYLKK